MDRLWELFCLLLWREGRDPQGCWRLTALTPLTLVLLFGYVYFLLFTALLLEKMKKLMES